MKKYVLICAITLLTFQIKAQFLNSVGITAGASMANQKFYFYNPDEVLKKKYVFGFNGSIFAEFFSYKYTRWISEIQYNQKGSLDKTGGANFPNKLSYLCWNNYLKIRYELFSFIPYVLIGPRLEYKLTQKTTSPPIVSSFSMLHVSAAFGAGVELVTFGNVKPFIEAFYNPDYKKQDWMMGYVTRPLLDVQNINIELRLGLKYQFKQRGSCNVPTYVE